MTCPDCERYKKSAAMWRNFAYESSGHPLPWKPEELWQGLTDDDLSVCDDDGVILARYWEAILKEKNA